ncbi:MAG: hypothetical protein K8R36_09710 [Planctomycetales bacterium]|nr:hypothetical protein [Planctomycetales bacterium]
MPPMLQVMRDIGGIDLPTSLVRLAGDESGSVAAAAPTPPTNGDHPVKPAKG